MGSMWRSHSLSADMFIRAYIHVLLRDQPLQHRKRSYTKVWRLRHPTFLLGSAIQRIMSNSFTYRHTSERTCSTICGVKFRQEFLTYRYAPDTTVKWPFVLTVCNDRRF